MGEVADRLKRRLGDLPPSLMQKSIEDTEVVSLPGNVPPWTSTGVRLTRGQRFTLFAAGRVVLSEEAGLWNGPSFHLWARVGGHGPVMNGTRDTYTFEAPHEGTLELCIYSGEWASPDGELATPLEGYAALTGGLDVAVVSWRDDAAAGLEALAQAAPEEPLFAAELARLAAPVVPPAGWHYLWFLGPADIYRSTREGERTAIHAHTRDDVGILQHPVDLPFVPGTRLDWRWRVEALPSARAEDTLPTHDYLSVAVEFDNGQDLSYYWSAEIAPETHFRCPLPSWDARETHLVVRSGDAALGDWHSESRDLYADYARAVGEPPGRIVAVWLIAVSLFQKGEGEADFADIVLHGDGEATRIV